MIEADDQLMELVDKIQLAHKYNEGSLTFNGKELTVDAAQKLVDDYTKGGKRGSKKQGRVYKSR